MTVNISGTKRVHRLEVVPENGQNLISINAKLPKFQIDASDQAQMKFDIAAAKIIINDIEDRLNMVEVDLSIIQAEIEEGQDSILMKYE